MTVLRHVVTSDDVRWLRWLDAECFPQDKPLVLGDAFWMLAWRQGLAVGFCGWTPRGARGFHYRAGVHHSARGEGLQVAMLGRREEAMRAEGLPVAVTYTEAYSAASMRSLIACGYRPFEADENTGLVLDPRYWKTMVYWSKPL